jgi:phage shock protein PspC (stress-responsive transcriptional regulator)
MNTTSTQQPVNSSSATDHEADVSSRPRPLYRPVHDRMLAGVAAGVARYFDVDVTIVRIVFAVLAVVGGVGVPLYLAGWLLIPDEGAEQSIASSFIQSLEARSR